MSRFETDLTESFKNASTSGGLVFKSDDLYVSHVTGNVYDSPSFGYPAYVINISNSCVDFAVRVWEDHCQYELIKKLVESKNANELRSFAFACLNHHQIMELIAKAHNIGWQSGKKELANDIKRLLGV